MTDEPDPTTDDPDDRALYLTLILGLLPFDAYVLAAVVRDLVTDAETTSWPSVLRRSANLGLVLGTVGMAGVMIFLFSEAGTQGTVLQNLGIGYQVGIAVVVCMFLAKYLLWLMGNIDSGDSPIVPQGESNIVTHFGEFALGVCMIGLVIIPFVGVLDTHFIFLIALVIMLVGVGLTGICLTIGGAFQVIAALTGPRDQAGVDEVDEQAR